MEGQTETKACERLLGMRALGRTGEQWNARGDFFLKKICTVELWGPRSLMKLLTPPTLSSFSPATFRLAHGNQGYGDSDEPKFL